jgi:hypothetical protein
VDQMSYLENGAVTYWLLQPLYGRTEAHCEPSQTGKVSVDLNVVKISILLKITGKIMQPSPYKLLKYNNIRHNSPPFYRGGFRGGGVGGVHPPPKDRKCPFFLANLV